jgi:hypothetical protein
LRIAGFAQTGVLQKQRTLLFPEENAQPNVHFAGLFSYMSLFLTGTKKIQQQLFVSRILLAKEWKVL